MDILSLYLKKHQDWSSLVEIDINGISLLDMIQKIELPFASKDEQPELAGHYEYLPRDAVVPPSMHLFGEPEEIYWVDDEKVAVLFCECGDPGCWPLIVRIKVEDNQVIWSDFEQPHRPDWDYTELGPFTFNRAQYEEQLSNPLKNRRKQIG